MRKLKKASFSDAEITKIVEDAKLAYSKIKADPFKMTPVGYNFNGFVQLMKRLLTAIIERKEIPERNKSELNSARSYLDQKSYRLTDSTREKLHSTLHTLLKFWDTFAELDVSSSEGSDFFKIDNLLVRILTPITDEKIEKVKKIIHRGVLEIQSSTIPHLKDMLKDLNVFIVAGKKTNAMAWYRPAYDDIYLQEAYLEKYKDLDHHVSSFIHEVGHRYYKKILTADQKFDWTKIYQQTLAKQKRREFKDQLPDIGDSLSKKCGVRYGNIDPDQDTVIAIDKDFVGRTYYKIQSGHKIYEHEIEGFLGVPSGYSKKDSEEFFCETLAEFLMEDSERIRFLKNQFISVFKGGRGTPTPLMTIPLDKDHPESENMIAINSVLKTEISVKLSEIIASSKDPNIISWANTVLNTLNNNNLIAKENLTKIDTIHANLNIKPTPPPLVKKTPATPPPQAVPQKNLFLTPENIKKIELVKEKGDSWERNFASTLEKLLGNPKYKPTQAQIDALEKAYSKLTGIAPTPPPKPETPPPPSELTPQQIAFLEKFEILLGKIKVKDPNSWSENFITTVIQQIKTQKGNTKFSDKQKEWIKKLLSQYGV
jgi:hypothetical protein